MKHIWKFEIKPNSVKDDVYRMVLEVPKGAKPLRVAMQNCVCCVWMEVDIHAPLVSFVLSSIGTGFGAVPNKATYLGTVIDGGYVWHIYY